MNLITSFSSSFFLLNMNIGGLAFTRQKAGREVGPLNWTQEHESVWYSPHRRLCATSPGQRAIFPLRSRTLDQRTGEHANSDRRPLHGPARMTRGDFLEIGHFALFSQFLHINDLWNFLDVSLSVHVYLWPYEPWKVSWKSVRTFLRNPEDRHTDRRIYR